MKVVQKKRHRAPPLIRTTRRSDISPDERQAGQVISAGQVIWPHLVRPSRAIRAIDEA